MAISDDATGKDSVAPDDPLTLRNRALAATAEGVTISDCRLPDNPIIILEAEDRDRNHFGLSGLAGLAAVLDAARDRTLDEAVMAVGARLEVWCAGRGLSDDASMVALEVLPDEREERS